MLAEELAPLLARLQGDAAGGLALPPDESEARKAEERHRHHCLVAQAACVELLERLSARGAS